MVDCAFGSPASDVAAVVVQLFGCVGSNERTAGDLGSLVFWQWCLPERVLEAWFIDDGLTIVYLSSVVVISDESLVL
jgi:hypothetical protein